MVLHCACAGMLARTCVRAQGPTVLVWYRLLAARTTGPLWLRPLKMVLVDQAFFSPMFLTTMLCLLRTMEGCPPRETFNSWKRDFLPIFTTGLKVSSVQASEHAAHYAQLWPAVQLVNFYLVPLNYRLLTVQCVSLFWNTYLSNKTQKARSSTGDTKLTPVEEMPSPY